MTTPPRIHPKDWTSADDLNLDKAIRKVLPTKPADHLDPAHGPLRDTAPGRKRPVDPGNKSSHSRRKTG
jgi:hypothetical protein